MEELKDNYELKLLQELIANEKYEEIYSILKVNLNKSFHAKTARIISLQKEPPAFNSNDMIRKGELLQLKGELAEFILLLEDEFVSG